ncbi:MAG TPA: signal peptidase II [Actinomycetota bacterium]
MAASTSTSRAALLFAVAAIVIAIDQATKALALAALTPGESTPVIGGVLHWTLQRNPGAAFGIFQRFPVVFTVLATAVSVWIVARAGRAPDRGHAAALGLILGGAVGNLVDRITREPGILRGEVIDFIDLRVWPVFNVADSGVVAGAVLLLLVSWRAERRAKREQGE